MKGLAWLGSLALGLSLFPPVQAVPLSFNNTLHGDNEDVFGLQRRADHGDFFLRIMPLGASITAGAHWEPVNPPNTDGYRRFLRDKLRSVGWDVNMVGSQQSGDMLDNSHEGISGDKVRSVAGRGIPSARTYKPNVILINAGTNDAREDTAQDPLSTIHLRMEEMILSLFAAIDSPVVVLSTLLPCPACNGRIPQVNEVYRALVSKLSKAPYNKRILLAEMNDGSFITNNDIHDGTHPTIAGQKKMAAVWYDAIKRAYNKGWISPPEDNGSDDTQGDFHCAKTLAGGNSNGRGGWQVLAAGNSLVSDDGRYKHGSIRHAEINKSSRSNAFSQAIRFANLHKINPNAEAKDSFDELVIIQHVHKAGDVFDTKTEMRWYNNNLGTLEGSWSEYWDFPQACDPAGSFFGDVDGDGYDDLLCVTMDGQVDLYRHDGQSPFAFEARRTWRARRPGCLREHVRLGDIDGDGRLDYCCIGSSGNIFCSRNGRQADPASPRWQDLGTVFGAKGLGDIRGVRFVDINGDGRSDWIWLAENGRSVIYINQRGTDKTMIPLWTEAASSHGGGFTLNDPGSRDNIQFGRVYGSGRADYMVVETNGCAKKNCERVIHAYENVGSGGKFQKGDGAFWGDMRGRGVDDYLWISPDGVVNLFPNQNTKENTAEHGNVDKGIWGGVFAPIKTGKDRRSLHIADWNGDGKEDIISVDKWTGHLTIWISGWNGNSYTPRIITRNSANYCTQGWGVGYFDNGHHFADLDGDGRADFLCMEKDGRTTAWKNNGPGDGTLVDIGQVKFGENLDRENFRFAPVHGGPRTDMIWLDKFGGKAQVWKNLEYLPGNDRVSGSKVRWTNLGPLYLQSARGANMHFPNLGGQGRADMVEVRPDTAHGFAWFNMCPAGAADDPGWGDPNLPAYTGGDGSDGGDLSDPDGDKFCAAEGEQAWTEELWQKMDMEGWMRQRFVDYIEAPSWPVASEPGGIPSIIAEYSRFDKDDKFAWKDLCGGISAGPCNVEQSDLLGLPFGNKCKGHARRAFMIWAARNYARYLTSYYNSMKWDTIKSSLSFGSISADFSEPFVEDEALSLSSWFTIANGILSTVTAFIPAGAGQVTGTALAGLAGLAGTVAEMFEDTPVDDHHLAVWRDLGYSFDKALTAAMGKMEAHFQQLLAARPGSNDREPADALVKVLGSGSFANSFTSAARVFESSNQASMIHAAAISAVWNQQRVYLFRWDETIKIGTFEYNPCTKPGNKGENGFDTASVCIGGVNYAILKWDMDYDASVKKKFGQDTETLRKYSFSQEDVFKGSWDRQEVVRSFDIGDHARNMFGRHIQKLVDGNKRPGRAELQQWTIPVCNWKSTPRNTLLVDTCKQDKFECFWRLIVKNCADMYYSQDQGAGWPYRMAWEQL